MQTRSLVSYAAILPFNTKTSLPYIRTILDFFLTTPAYPTYHWLPLFPAYRASRPNTITAPLYYLFQAVDAIDRQFGYCHVSLGACLRLPFSTLIEHRLPSSHSLSPVFQPPQVVDEDYPGVLQLTGNDVLTFDQESQALQVRSSACGLPHRNSSLRAVAYINSQQMLFIDFLHFSLLRLIPRPTMHHIDTNTITSYSESIHLVSNLLF
ncbi:unnamed protein product [Mucor fragilis]